jgi:hypothetical protein
MRNGFMAFKAGTSGESKRWEILGQLRNWRLLKKVSAAWSEIVYGVQVLLLACDGGNSFTKRPSSRSKFIPVFN